MYKIYEIYNGAIITSVIFDNYGPMTSQLPVREYASFGRSADVMIPLFC